MREKYPVRRQGRSLVIAGIVVLAGCSGGPWPEGLRKTPPGDGPVVKWDLDSRPFPDVPFPNNVATRLDPSSPTGRRVNVSLEAPTKLEVRLRRKLDTLSGFGTYAPIMVSFTEPLDIGNIVSRHKVNDFSGDTVLLININRKSPDFGRAMPLDIGDGNFPFVVPKKDNYFDNDPLYTGSSIAFPDSNVVHPGGDPDYDLMTFYVRDTNTLFLQPILPLEEESLYAVVLTGKLVGQNGLPVRSPFPYVNHLDQTADLEALKYVLPRYGLTIDDVAFTWDFTTQSTTREMTAIRKGMYGKGPLGRLADRFPGTVDRVLPLHTFTDSSVYILRPETLTAAVAPYVTEFIGGGFADVEQLINTYRFVDYLVAGEYTTPYFLNDRDGMAAPGYPDDENEIMDIDPLSGRAIVGPSTVSFICSIPKAGPWGKPPFPVVIDSHGYGIFKLQMLGFAANFARYGIASCAIDAVGHGLCLDKSMETLVRLALQGAGFGPLFDLLSPGRARDLNNDGTCDPGGDFFTPDVFHTRDIVRQSIIDQMQLIRILRGFDGTQRWAFDPVRGNGGSGVAGDFNGDGIPDLGGPATDYFSWGISLGGILSSILPGVEPAITAGAPNSGGAGLANLAIRSIQGGVVEAVYLRTMGPFVLGIPQPDRTTQLSFMIADVNKKVILPFASAASGLIAEGDTVAVRNLATGKEYSAMATSASCYDPDNGSNHQWRAAFGPCVRVNFAADAARAGEKRVKLGITLKDPGPKDIANTSDFGDRLRVEIRDGATGSVKQRVTTFEQDVVFQGGRYRTGSPLVSLSEGFGLMRSGSDFRKFLGVSAIILEPGDPVTWAPHYFQDPIDYSDTEPGLVMGANVLDVPTIGDMNVPINTGINIARAAGMIPLFQPDARTFTISTTGQTFTAYQFSQDDVILKGWVNEGLWRLNRYTDAYGGLLLDLDNLSEGRDFTSTSPIGFPRTVPRLDPPLRATVATKTGVSGMRIPYMDPRGHHGFDIPHPGMDFDVDAYMIHLIGRFFQTRGTEIHDDICLEMTGRYAGPCPFIPLLPEECATFVGHGWTCTSVNP